MGELPTGALTFLFTDVVGSTRHWQEHPDAMAAALAVHDDILRSSIEDGGGHVFSTAGDSFAAAFSTVSAGIAAAVTAQRHLDEATWPGELRLDVRMGIHTGKSVERGGDHFGPTLNLTARAMSVAHGGQIVATEASTRLMDRPTPGIDLIELGAHALRDIDGAIVLHQVVANGLRKDFPPLRTTDASVVSLPSMRSSFVGRADEIARGRRALFEYRLVTLTGVGGCGKTRLAVEIASRDIARFEDGVRFVDLARIGDDAGVAEALALAIDVVPNSAGPIGQQVRRRLGSANQLLVIDNCEHVIDEVVDQVDALLAECPNVRVLATSREPLDLDGELIVRVPPLDLDGDGGRSAAEMLFVERMVDLGVATADNEADESADDEAVAAICRRLDGLPLAIELAAARTPVLSPSQILQRLDDRFSLLTGGRRRTRGRHQTLEATIGWSFELLDDDERDALRRISVMPAAFDLEMAAAVLDASPGATLDLLEGLVARSLLQSVRDEGGSRFRLLETVRSYAHDRLIEHGDVEATRDRHARHVAARLDRLGISFQSLRPVQGPIADDVLAAIDWARACEDRSLAADLLADGLGIPIARGAYNRALDVAAWATEADDPLVRSRAHLARGFLAMVAESDGPSPLKCAEAALEAAADKWAPWRASAHVLTMVYSVLSNGNVYAEHARLARSAIERGEFTLGTEERIIWLDTVGQLWRNEEIDGDRLARLTIEEYVDPLTLVNLLGARLLAPLFEGDAATIERELNDATAIEARRMFLDGAIRGDHWALSYEVIRCAALAMLGQVDEARADLADVLRHVGSDPMPGIEEDFLGAFAWACIAAGELTRAAELLDDTWVIARTPTTILMITAAQERALDLPIDPDRRTSELVRRIRLRETIRGEDRTRRALDDELARLGLPV